MSKYVISTLTADNRYVGWNKSGGVNMIERSVVVRGGAGIPRASDAGDGATPSGVRTQVSDEDAEFLANHPHFQQHAKGGFVKIVNTAQDPEKAAQSMDKDASGPKTAKDVAADNKKNEKDDGTPPLQAVQNNSKKAAG